MNSFYRNQLVKINPDVIPDLISNGYLSKQFDPNTVGVLDTPQIPDSSFRWAFVCTELNIRIGVEEYEIAPAISLNR